jgi:hypothetical protein
VTKSTLIPWDELTAEQQLRLREEYGCFLDEQPLTCSLETKIERFTNWLAEHGVAYSQDNADSRP